MEPAPQRSLRIGGTEYPVLLPALRDPRLHLAATITSLQILGQAFLGFELSIAQILLCVGTCGLIDAGVAFRDRRVIMWPASALLTGNGVAFILRVDGTAHGDWWSLNGWYIFVATAALALASKHVLRIGDRPLFNPSNFGLVVCFLVVGTRRANPLDFWWGPMSPALVAAIVVIAVGGLFITARLRLLAMSVAFWLTFAAGLAVVAAGGHCMSTRWSVTPVCGQSFWWVLVTSPEVLVFLLFMITDPRTIPTSPRARVAFGVAVGLGAALLIAPQRTEFSSKVALLGALVLVCLARPLLDRAFPTTEAGGVAWPRRRLAATSVPAVAVAALILVVAGAPARQPLAAADTAVTSRRPLIDLEPGAVPEVTIGDDVARVIGAVSPEQARALGTAVVEDLRIEADAIGSGDPELAAAALSGPRLDETRARIAAGGAEVFPSRVNAMSVVVVRDPSNSQAVPRIGVRISTAGPPARPDRVLVMDRVGETYLISDELPAG